MDVIKQYHDHGRETMTADPIESTHFLEPNEKPFEKSIWIPGEAAAHKRLDEFVKFDFKEYAKMRDFPVANLKTVLGTRTSGLSPYLSVGSISIRQIIEKIHPNAAKIEESIFMNELIWRDFYRHILHYFPKVCRGEPFKKEAKNLKWDNPEGKLQVWMQGKTGYPIVDAGMRQLNTTGWMHNRLRMICASFLVKDLLIDWKLGEQYFMQQLIDGELREIYLT